MENRIKAYISIILFTIIMGLSFLFTKISLEYSTTYDILAHRFTIAFLLITLLAIFKRKELNFRKRDFIKIMPLGLISPVLFFCFQILGLQFATSAEAGIIQATSPIFIMILASIFLKEKVTIIQKFFVILSVSGILFIFVMRGAYIQNDHLTGMVLLLLSCLLFSVFSILMRKYTQSYNVFKITFFLVLVGFVTFNGMSLVERVYTSNLSGYFFPFKNVNYLISILYLGIFATFLTSILANYSYSKIEASKLGVFGNITPIVTIIGGVIVLGEKVSIIEIAGTIMIIIGVIGTNVFSNKKKK